MGLAIVACGGGTGSDDGGGSTGSSGDAEGASSVDDGVTGSSSSSVDEGSTGASVTTMPADSSESTSSPSSSSSGSGGDPGTEIVHVDFERDVEGPYTEEMVEADFGIAPPWNDGLDDGRATIVADDGQFLRVTYPGGQYGPGDGGVQFIVALPATYDELRLSYRVRFGDGFEFVKGGKLPGLVGGSSPTGCVEDTDGFSARMMWRTDGAAVQYMYFPEKIEACGDDYAYAIAFTPGAWHTVEHRIVMNTPGEHDGVLQAWFDGELALDDTAFLYRLADGTYGVDALYFSTFFGGGDATWAPSADQTVDFDDFVITAP
jgi:hypothetical protein